MSTLIVLKIAGLMTLAAALVSSPGCGNAGSDSGGDASAPVYINPEISLAPYLEAEDAVTVEDAISLHKTQELLSMQLQATWTATVTVSSASQSEPIAVASCADFFAAEQHDAEPVRPFEFTPYRDLGLRCYAAELASRGQAAAGSEIGGFALDGDMPSKLPKELAFVTSQSEFDRLQADESITTWAQVNDIQSVDQINDNAAHYKLPGAVQELTVLARIDLDSDGLQDVLLHTLSYVEEGSYTAPRLFVLTRTSNEQRFQLLESFK